MKWLELISELGSSLPTGSPLGFVITRPSFSTRAAFPKTKRRACGQARWVRQKCRLNFRRSLGSGLRSLSRVIGWLSSQAKVLHRGKHKTKIKRFSRTSHRSFSLDKRHNTRLGTAIFHKWKCAEAIHVKAFFSLQRIHGFATFFISISQLTNCMDLIENKSPKRYQNSRFWPLSGTTSIPDLLIWESPPPPGGGQKLPTRTEHDDLVAHLLVRHAADPNQIREVSVYLGSRRWGLPDRRCSDQDLGKTHENSSKPRSI